jgi:hypothetical protein
VFTDIPVQPDADTAREWAVHELSKPQYQPQGDSFITKVWNWIVSFFDHLFTFSFGGGPIGAITVILVIAGLAFVIVRLTLGPVRRAMKARRTHSVFEDDSRTSAQMRAAANAAAAQHEWNLAVLERFRAIVRSLEERELIDDLPGVTAQEAALQTGGRFPDVALATASGADLFDGVRYGRVLATQADDDSLRRLDSLLAGRTLLTAAQP